MARRSPRRSGRLGSPAGLIGLTAVPACSTVSTDASVQDGLWLAFALAISVALLVVTVTRDRRRQQDMRAWQSASTEKDRFLASVSHELRTPLTAIIGMLDLLVDGRTEIQRAEFDEFLLAARQQAHEMSRLVDDYVIAGRLSSHALTLRLGEVDLDDATASVIQGVDLLRGVKLHVASPLGHAVGDALRIRQIARNLVRNAVRYAVSEVRIETLRAGGTIHLEVRNDGPPVAADLMDSLFEPFVGSNRPGQPDSLGLGLAISRGLARRMGGDLAYRRQDRWTVFSLRLSTTLPADPVVRPDSPADGGERMPRRRPMTSRSIDPNVATGLALVVQPIIDLREGRIAGFETLARVVGDNGRVLHWPEAVETYPADLLQAQAVERALELSESRPDGTFLSVNLDTALLGADGVISAFLSVSDLDSIVVELSDLGPDLSRAQLESIDRLRSRNALVAVGDRGSDIHQLLELRPDFIKIDRTTVSSMTEGDDGRVLIESIAELSTRFEARLVAQGVERAPQLDTLIHARVPLAQGYLLARPAPPWPAIDSSLRVQLGSTNRLWAVSSTLSDLISREKRSPSPSEIVLSPDGTTTVRWEGSVIDEPMLVRLTESSEDVLRRAMARPAGVRFTPIVALGPDDEPLGVISIDQLIEATLLDRHTKSDPA